MNAYLDDRLLERYLAGEASAEEGAAVRRWLEAHPGADAILAGVRDALAHDAAGWDVDGGWERLSARLAARPGPALPEQLDTRAASPPPQGTRFPDGAGRARVLRLPQPGSRRRGRGIWLVPGLAAALLGGLLAWRAGLLAPPRAAQVAPLAELSTGVGRRATLRLPDGTRVRLDAGSRLRYPARPDAGASLQLYLEGQAFFDVAHRPGHGLTVHAGGALVRDIGTEFGVTAYPGRSVRVVVARGRVAVTARAGSRELQAGDLARVDSAGRLEVRQGVDVRSYLAWTEGILAFEDRPLGDVVPELGRWYGVQIRVADTALAHRPLTAEFREESLPRTLDAIAVALGVRWVRAGDVVTLEPARP